MSDNRFHSHKRIVAGAAAALALTLTACGSDSKGAQPDPDSQSGGASSSFTPVPEATTTAAAPDPSANRPESEASSRNPRLGVTYDGGVLVLDGKSLKVLADFPLEGFTRLNAAGDGRHLMVTEGNSFRLLDMGSWSQKHGDHSHRYTTSPLLTDITFPTKKPGHVVVHDGVTALYGDESGLVEQFDPKALKGGTKPATQKWTDPSPHHGVAIIRADGTMITTLGDSEGARGIRILDKARNEITRLEKCPGTHGEAAGKDGVVTIGCQDGLVIIKGNTIKKVQAADSYGRIGNQFGHEASPVILGDYKVQKDVEVENPTRVSLTDTRTGQLRLVDVTASYSFRSMQRGPEGEALVLGDDGKLRVIDPEAAKVTAEIPVTQSWKEPQEWQQPRPTLFVLGENVYVTEPSQRLVHVIDLGGKKVANTVQLPRTPNEINGTPG